MPTIIASKKFNASPEAVWGVMSDFENAADRIQAIVNLEVVTDGPVGVGTRFRETRIMFKKRATEEMEITGWDPPNSYTTECDSCGCHYTSIITVAPDGSGARVDMSFDATPMTFMAKLMFPLGKLRQKKRGRKRPQTASFQQGLGFEQPGLRLPSETRTIDSNRSKEIGEPHG